MSRKKTAILILVVIALPLAFFAGVFTILQSPAAVNALAAFLQPVTGIALHVEDISLNRHLEARVKGLRVHTIKDRGFDLSLAQGEVHARPGLKVEVEKIVLTGPKFSFYIKKKKEDTDPFEVLRKLPAVRLLDVKNGQLELKSDSFVSVLPGMDMTIRDFKPEGGGTLKSRSRFDIRSTGMTGRGMLETTLDFSRFSPRPSGSGILRLSLERGSSETTELENLMLTTKLMLKGNVLSLDGAMAAVRSFSQGNKGSGRISIHDIKASFSGSYDQKTSCFDLTSFEGSGGGIGTLKVRASGTVKPLSWDVSLRAFSVDLAQVFRMASPHLPETFRSWTFKGKGGLEMDSKGQHINDRTVWKATAFVDLSEGGFASPDNSKAGERITGRIELKLSSPEQGRKGSFRISVKGHDGELLWGQYYSDFKGRKVEVVSQGIFEQNPFSLSSSGTFDLFQTGHYVFSTDLSEKSSVVSLDAKRVSCPQLFVVLFQNFISQNYPNLQDLTLNGEFDLKLILSISPKRKMIEGRLALRSGSVRSASNRLLLSGLNIFLPYDLVLTGEPLPETERIARPGSVSFEGFEKADLKIGNLETPIILSGNRLILPNPIDFSLFGGEVRLAPIRIEELLFPQMRAETGLTVKHLNLEKLIGQASPFPLTGRIDGDLSPVVFEEGKWSAGGSLIARIFGGQVIFKNFSAGMPFSSSRFFGADVTFDAIDLEEVTANIKLGQMTGLIQGSLKDFQMEYGQPARFDLVITSDLSRKVPQSISVDAIKNLSIISTGSEAISDILNSGLNRFFHEYPYSEIGLRCTLADDLFSLRGLIHEGGKEYLIRRAPLRGIDIVNQNPDNSISFKDMAERMGRLFSPRQKSKDVPSG
ncbi:hypothetical protein SAMN04489760_1085 [Syntrophus gentianae]|uniref:AsmA-like C-terminal domain-containing protein n=1 Tax=Syntrophus gentianae TaxID=43775 RepID=A0A1H7WU96_9BACT|nr:hypothetical protein [Syntrophus gentianae]SEM25092.1 hypothetical protein SAMN04489760_1085 [Syntrophus gentianae]